MADNLVIVESPAKARTIKKYLGRDFDVLASYGHVRDLVPKEGAVNPDRGYAMRYQVLEKNERHVAAIARALGKSKALYLATDPDREGEAIAWHLKEILDSRGTLDGKDVHRVVFYEITRNAIREGEEEIVAFVAQEYWTIEGEGAHGGQAFPLKLLEYRGEKVEQFSFTNERAAREAENALRTAAGATTTAPGTL